jgi:hypothetical protein
MVPYHEMSSYSFSVESFSCRLRRSIAIMISAINTESIRKKIPSFLTVPFGSIIKLIISDILNILSNNAYMGYFIVAK